MEQEPELELELHCTFRDPYCVAFKNAEVYGVNKTIPAMGKMESNTEHKNARGCAIEKKHLEQNKGSAKRSGRGPGRQDRNSKRTSIAPEPQQSR